ncbi:MAG: response regulator transcription factor, partial [Thermomonas sp.]
VLMLTARDTLEDKLRGFGEGADDYMIKPFAMHELEARLRALHRRVQPTPTTLECGGLSYNSATMLATRDGRKVPLTRLQGSILATLLGDAPKVTSHQRLLQAAWGEDDGDIAALHTQIYELRAVIDRPFAHAMIQSVRGVGYRLVAVPS